MHFLLDSLQSWETNGTFLKSIFVGRSTLWNMKGIEDQRDVQEHILPYLYEYCGLVEKSPDIATEINEKESAANHKEVQSEAVTVKSSDRSVGEKKKSIHDRLKENKEKLGQKSGKDNPQKGVELT